MRHLDEPSWKALNAKDPGEEAYFAHHLRQPCAECEAFLQQVEVPALEGATDVQLIARRPQPQPGPVDELAFRRVLRGVRGPPSSRRWRWTGLAAGLAAAAVLVLVLPRPVADDELGGLKAAAQALEVSLSVVEQRADGTLVPLATGQSVRSDSRLLLRYRASARARAALLLERPGAPSPEVLTRLVLEPGVHDLASQGALMALTLDDEQGQISLRLLARPGGDPLAPPPGATEAGAGRAQSVILLHVEE